MAPDVGNMPEMKLLFLDSTPEVEQFAARFQSNDDYQVVTLPDKAALERELDATHLASSPVPGSTSIATSLLVLDTSALTEPNDVPQLLDLCRRSRVAVVLILDSVSELAGLGAKRRAALGDFAIRPVSPDVIYERIELLRQRQPAARPDDIADDMAIRRAFTARVIDAQEVERHTLSQELHDGIGQMMLVHYMDAEWLVGTAEPGPVRDCAERLCTSLGQTLRTVRNMAMDLRPPVIDDLGLGSALESLVKRHRERSGIDCDWEDESDALAVPTNVSVAIYRIAQEALENAARHSQCRYILVQLQSMSGGGLQLSVIDNGIGFDPARENGKPHLGLMGMRERAVAIGAHLVIESATNQGTCVKVVLPEILESSRE